MKIKLDMKRQPEDVTIKLGTKKCAKKFSPRIISVVLLIVVLSVLSVGAFAYLMDADSARNQFTIGGNRINIHENFTPPKELRPGVSFSKKVRVDNVGPVDCYVRVFADFTDSDMGQYCDVDWNTTDWVKNADGYYYYKHRLVSGDSTTNLFTKVTVRSNTPAAAIKDFDIIVYAESYQAADYADYQAAWRDFQKNDPT